MNLLHLWTEGTHCKELSKEKTRQTKGITKKWNWTMVRTEWTRKFQQREEELQEGTYIKESKEMLCLWRERAFCT